MSFTNTSLDKTIVNIRRFNDQNSSTTRRRVTLATASGEPIRNILLDNDGDTEMLDADLSGLIRVITSTKPTSPNKPPPTWHKPIYHNPDACTDCVACTEVTDPMFSLSCGHWYCVTCLGYMFTEASKKSYEGSLPVRCCRENIPLSDQVDLPHDVVTKYNRKLEELDTPVEKRLYCANGVCNIFVQRPNPWVGINGDTTVALCEICSTRTCVYCQALHDGTGFHQLGKCEREKMELDPSADEQAFIDEAREKGWKECYRCGAVVEKSKGCDHMVYDFPLFLFLLFPPSSSSSSSSFSRTSTSRPTPPPRLSLISHLPNHLTDPFFSFVLWNSCRCKAQFCYRCGVEWGKCKHSDSNAFFDERERQIHAILWRNRHRLRDFRGVLRGVNG